jgi:hypothetical protein
MEELKDKTPFHCIITGPTNCGKTKYLIETIRDHYRNVFVNVVLICPTYEKNDSYKGFANGDPRLLVLSPDADNVNEINEMLSLCKIVFSGENTLIILDDCAFSKDLKQRSNEFIKLAFSGRHDKISVWVLTQQLTAIAKPFRENVGCIVSFFNPAKLSNQMLFDEYGGDLDIESRKRFVKLLKSEKYSRIVFCLRHPFTCCLEIPNVNA